MNNLDENMVSNMDVKRMNMIGETKNNKHFNKN